MDRIKALYADGLPRKWLFYGDSITHGALHTWGHRDYTELFAERIRYELGRRNDIVINTATSGNTTADLLETFDWRVAQFKPDVVFIMIGMNDCNAANPITLEQFYDNLHALADLIEDLGGVPVLQTTCPIIPGCAPGREEKFDDYMQAIRNVAEERNLPLVDHTAYWLEHIDHHWYWMNDPFHPNEAGHRVFNKVLLEALGIWHEDSPTGRLNIAQRPL